MSDGRRYRAFHPSDEPAASTQLGHLFIVSTPIGNLDDMTLRAQKVLRDVDLIAAEDTRHTRRLLSHFGITTPMTSFHSFNERHRCGPLLDFIAGGRDAALVSDSGTPGISDPAYLLVRDAIQRGIPVSPVPGSSAFLAALVVSGLPMDRFVFEGFLPHRRSRRRRRLRRLRDEARTMVFYESPHRISDMLADALEILENRPASISRELTKKFEETRRGPLKELLETQPANPKGEFVVVVAGTPKRDGPPPIDGPTMTA